MNAPFLAFDRASVRTVDRDGRLHISVTNISKANICPYLGKEIPQWQNLGLDADRIYRLLRDPAELAAAAETFNNLPILDVHMAVTAWAEGGHRPDIVIGSTGTDTKFNPPYLQNSAVIWSRSAIDDIEEAIRAAQEGRSSRRGKREWSCAYYYTADMTPGNFEGLQYDGVMRSIIGNHVALVNEGRAGPDVMIGDCSMKSRMALFLSGALAGLVTPVLAADAKVDLGPLLDDITADNLSDRAGKLAVAVAAAVEPHLATDKALDLDDIVSVIAIAQSNPMAADAEPAPPAKDADPDKDKDKAPPGKDADPDDKDKDKNKDKAPPAKDADPAPSMDEASVKALAAPMIAAAVASERERNQAIAQARIDVAAHVGQVTGAADSAEGIYALALDAAGVSREGVPESAYRHMVSMLQKPGEGIGAATAQMANDAVAQSGFGKRFPTARQPSKVI